jgi:hypothetical protein
MTGFRNCATRAAIDAHTANSLGIVETISAMISIWTLSWRNFDPRHHGSKADGFAL